MSIVSDSLPILDDARGILDDVGLRPYRVLLRITKWSGDRPGKGGKVVTETELFVADSKRPKVRQLSAEDVIASGGTFSDRMFQIGPFTPAFSGGGLSPSDLDPALDGDQSPQTIDFVLIGPGTGDAGIKCSRVSDKLDSPFRYMVTVRQTGQAGDE